MRCERSISGGNDYRFIVLHTDFEMPQGDLSGEIRLKV